MRQKLNAVSNLGLYFQYQRPLASWLFVCHKFLFDILKLQEKSSYFTVMYCIIIYYCKVGNNWIYVTVMCKSFITSWLLVPLSKAFKGT